MLADIEKDETKKPFGNKDDADFVKALEFAQQWQKTYDHADKIPDSELPVEHDFRNIQGYDFLNDHRDQGSCGSCYTIGFAQAVNARLNLKYGVKSQNVSPQQAMNCNFLVEGCEGGWPHFDAYFYEHAHLIAEDCAPYTGTTKQSSCSNWAQC